MLALVRGAALGKPTPCGFYAVACHASNASSSVDAYNVEYVSRAFGAEHNGNALKTLRQLRGRGRVYPAYIAHMLRVYGLLPLW
jgi:hypothetical protein